MNNYKELLSQIAHCMSEESCDGCTLNSGSILDPCVDTLLEKASDAIEQLVRERDADEKQIPKRPTQNVFNAWCPNCKEALGKKFAEIALTTRFNNYCPNCGQALDWSEEA